MRPFHATVTVVMPTFRRSSMLERAIESVKAQTRPDWELFVIDDNGAGTPDQLKTEAFMRRFDDEPRIEYVVHDTNLGACAARNTGIRRSSAPFIAFLDDDDVWYPFKLARQLEILEAMGPDVGLVYGGITVVDPEGRRTDRLADGKAHTWEHLWRRNGVGTTSVVLCRRSALTEIGGFDERLPSMQDYDLYVRLASRFNFAWAEEPLLAYRRHTLGNIGVDYEAAVVANRIFYEKHRASFENDPILHHHRLRSFALDVMRSGRISEARSLLWRAWRVRPSAVMTLVLAATLNTPLLHTYRFLGRGLRTFANAFERARDRGVSH